MDKRKRKNRRLKIITWFASMGAVVSICLLDSESYIPLIFCGICLGWLVLMYAANCTR